MPQDLDRLIEGGLAPRGDLDSEIETMLGDEVEMTPGTSPYAPIEEQHPRISNLDRFNIMSAGGGGEGAARALKKRGFDVVHRGGMNLSVRAPFGQWHVLDPDKLEFMDIADLAGDVGSILAMTVGGFAGSPGGIPGAMAGAGAAGAAFQGLRSGYGELTGASDATSGEVARDVAIEGALGAGGELLAPVVGGMAKWAKGKLFPPRFAAEEARVLSKVPVEEGVSPYRSIYEIAEMDKPMIMGEWLPEDFPKRIPFERGRVEPPIKHPTDEMLDEAGQVLGYQFKDLYTKVGRERYPEVAHHIDQLARSKGVTPQDAAIQFIADEYGQAGVRFLDQVDFMKSEPDLLVDLLDFIARKSLTRSEKRIWTKQLARAWGIDTKGMTDYEIARVALRRMADDDFVYREAARKLGIPGAFSPDANLDDLAAQIFAKEQARWSRIQASAALMGAEGSDVIEASFLGGPQQRQFMKRPPSSPSELQRAEELAPYIHAERLGRTTPAPGTPRRPPLEEPTSVQVRLARQKQQDALNILMSDPQNPVAQQFYRDAVDEVLRAEADLIPQLMRQQGEVVKDEYQRRVFGDIPSLAAGKKVGRGPHFYDEALVDLEERSRQIFERRAGVPWKQAKGEAAAKPKGFALPGEFRPGRSGGAAGGPQGGVIPRAEAVDFWRYISLQDLSKLRVGGREINLTPPQQEAVRRTLWVMGVSPGMKVRAKWLKRLAGLFQLPRNAMRFALQAKAKSTAGKFAQGLAGPATGFMLGGPLGAAAGLGLELLGRGAARAARRLLRQPGPEMLQQLILEAVRKDRGKAARALHAAQDALEKYGETAYRAMIFSALHEPEFRALLEGR